VTLSALYDLTLGLAFPRRFSQSLLLLKQHHVRNCLTEIQRHIPRFQDANVEIVDGSFDIMVSGASLFDAPDGQVIQVVVGGEGCQTQHAVMCSHLHLQQMQVAFANAYDCGDPEIPSAYPTATVHWARDDGDLLVYPWVPAGLSIGVRWRGIKRNWAPTNDIWWANEDRVTEAIRRYLVAYDKEGCEGFADALTMFRDELATLKAEQFHILNPTQYNPYEADILFPAHCVTHGDTSSAIVGST
jgi:hypothetical protein